MILLVQVAIKFLLITSSNFLLMLIYMACKMIIFLSLFSRIFVALVTFANSRLTYIPLDLILGFFVAGVLTRFWYLYNIIGWMDKYCFCV